MLNKVWIVRNFCKTMDGGLRGGTKKGVLETALTCTDDFGSITEEFKLNDDPNCYGTMENIFEERACEFKSDTKICYD